MLTPIEDYALIGDLHTAAIVSREGSVDWLCLPRFDSDACFAALLGTPQHGRWLITPLGETRKIRRQYRPDTLVLETEYETAEGSATVVDCMPLREQHPAIVRTIEGKTGNVRMHMELIVRFHYGSVVPRVQTAPKMDLRDKIHETVCREGYDVERGAFTQSLGSTKLDRQPLDDSDRRLPAARRFPRAEYRPGHRARVDGGRWVAASLWDERVAERRYFYRVQFLAGGQLCVDGTARRRRASVRAPASAV